ncbi:MAG: hypothetical protein LC121_17925 [Anaerolineae bacterium]|nr:hypothetical protein [Anaerolineae bacterium]
MKNVGRFLTLTLLAALLVIAPGAALAQGGPNPICTGLVDADCQLLTGASAAMEGVRSFSIPSYSINFLLNSAAGETTFNVSGSGHVMVPEGIETMESPEGLLLHLVMDSVAYSTPTDSNAGSGEILVLDNMLYVKFNDEWYGGTLEDEEGEVEEGLDETGLEDLADLRQQFADLGVDLTGVVSSVRNADGDAMGQPTASFTTSVDITGLFLALLQSPAVGEAMGMAGEGEDAMTPEDLQMVAAFIAPMFQGTTISLTQEIGTEDNLIHSLAFDLVLNADLSMFAPEIGAVAGTLNFAADLDEYNGAFEVPAPESYRPLEELEAQLEGMTEGLGL